MSGRKPKRLYWLEVTTIGKLKYRQRGGGKFSSRTAMLARQTYLRRDGIESVAYESKPIEWVELEKP
jgi:hypothetical protein